MSFLATLKGLFGFGSKGSALAPGDRLLSCEDCNKEFVFDLGEQRFFKEKGFTDPKRCPKCRRKVRSRMRRRRGRGHFGGGHSNGHDQSQSRSQGRSPRDRDRGRRHSVIDGDSPYADER